MLQGDSQVLNSEWSFSERGAGSDLTGRLPSELSYVDEPWEGWGEVPLVVG